MKISRRSFLRYCGSSAAAIGLGGAEILRLESVLAAPGAPSVVWLQGSSCTGCSVSLLNRISADAPRTAGDLLIETIDLVYHPNLMGPAGESAVAAIDAVREKGYVLAVEGGIPTAFGGAPCWAWSRGGRDVTFAEAVEDLAAGAAAVVAVGTCASWGGMAAAPPNPTEVKGVLAATGRTSINIAGCPPHPDWIVWAVAQLLIGNPVPLDANGRPEALYGRKIHDTCPRKGKGETKTYGVDGRCLKDLGCRGPSAKADCVRSLWNNRQNWCIDANSPCIGCTEPGFPGTRRFYDEDD